MAPRIRPLIPSELAPEQNALYGAITGGPRARGPQHFALTADDGSLRGPFDVMLRSPAVGTAQQELGAAIRYRTGLTDRMRELAILLVAAHWDSAFERDSHEAIARAIGFTEEELGAIRVGDVPCSLKPRRTVGTAVGRAAGRRPFGRGVGCGIRRPRCRRRVRAHRARRRTTRPSRCNCACSASTEIARSAQRDTVSLYESR